MGKCAYCGKKVETPHPTIVGREKSVLTCCCGECAEKAVEFSRHADKCVPVFAAGIAVAMILVFIGAIAAAVTNSLLIICVAMGLIGLDTLIFPFATPETFSLLGIKRTILLTRGIGVAVIFLGVIFAIWLR